MPSKDIPIVQRHTYPVAFWDCPDPECKLRNKDNEHAIYLVGDVVECQECGCTVELAEPTDEDNYIERIESERADLLEACKAALENISGMLASDDIPSTAVRDQLRAAITKASPPAKEQ